MALKSESESLSAVSDSLRPRGLYSPWNSPGQNTGVGSLSLLQGIFPTQEWNLGLLHCRWSLYQLSYQGSPEMGEGAPKCVTAENEKALKLVNLEWCWLSKKMIKVAKWSKSCHMDKQFDFFVELQKAKWELVTLIKRIWTSYSQNMNFIQNSLKSIHTASVVYGERNDNPFQYSCLENPVDRGACWAAVYGVT